MRTSILLVVVAACSSTPAHVTPPPEPVAVAIVYQGSFNWMGEELAVQPDTLEDGTVILGGYLALRVALDTAFADLPRSSDTTLVACGYQATTVASGQSDTITSAAIGDQMHFKRTTANDLLGGIEIGLEALARSKQPQKLLVVIGDGSHFNRTEALADLPSIGARIRSAGIVANAFIVVPNEYNGDPVVGVAMPTERVEVPWNLVGQLRSYVRAKLALRQI